MTESLAERRRVMIDTDGGIDDAAALWWAVTDPRIDLIGVTTVDGVVSAQRAARNVERLLAAAGRADIPIGVGSGDRLGPVPELRSTDFIHGADGLGNTTRGEDPVCEVRYEAAELLHRLCAQSPGAVSIVSIGPLTNLAHTIGRYPEWAGSVREFVAMGGSAAAGGNALPNGEFNVAADPVAASIVVGASWSSPPLMVGLDVTHAATLTEHEFALLRQGLTPAAAYLDAPLHFYRRHGAAFTTPDCPCHDLVAVMALVEPSLISQAPVLPLAVDIAMGVAWASTIVDFRTPILARVAGAEPPTPRGFSDWRIAMKADVGLFRQRVQSLFGER
jgi:purine nucleosidase